MPSFNAETIVEPMHCKLRPYADFEGNIPEPTTLQVQAYLNATRLEAERIRKETADAPEGEDLEATLKRLGPAQVKKMVRKNAEILAALCSGIPSADQLEKLPHREFAAFANWLAEEVLNPEAGAGAGNAQVISLPSAAAG